MAKGGYKPAGPSGAELLARVQRELERRAWPAGLTALTGEDRFHLDRAQRALLDALVPEGEREYGLSVYDTAVDVSVVVAAARSLGMFAPVRVVLVRDLSALQGRHEAIEEYAGRPPAGSYLIVRAPKLDRRRKLDSALATSGRLLAFERPASPAAAVPQIRVLAKEKGLELDRDAAETLALIIDGDYWRADAELEKLRAWTGKGGRVGIAELREVVAGSTALKGWELADAVGQRDRKAALEALRQLLGAGEEPLKLLGGLSFRCRALLAAKAAIAAGSAPRSALSSARLFGAPDETLLAGLARHGLRELLGFPAALLEADRALKNSSPAAAALERLVEKLTEPAVQGRRA